MKKLSLVFFTMEHIQSLKQSNIWTQKEFLLEFKKIENIYKVTVNFVSEIITCVKDKNNQIIEGNPNTKKTVNDVWRFAKNMWSQNPTWYLIDTSSKQ